MTAELGPSSSPVREQLRAGLAWLRSADHPADAVVSQFGGCTVGVRIYDAEISTEHSVDTDWRFLYSADAHRTDRYRSAVPDTGQGIVSVNRAVGRRLTDEHCNAIRAEIEAAGFTVVDAWNGAGSVTGSWRVRGVHPSLNVAHANYLLGCPVHQSVFCGLEGCTWLSAGNQRLVPLVAPPSVSEHKGGGAPEGRDRNLATIDEVLREVRRLLADDGILAAQANPARLGTLEDGVFTDGNGVGIAFPAELALELVRRAVSGLPPDL